MHSTWLNKKVLLFVFFAALLVSVHANRVMAAGHGAKEEKGPAILLVTFGTSIESAQVAFKNIEKRFKAAFPKTVVRWAYTSKMIRKKLEKKGVQVDSPEMAMVRLMDEGYTKVAVQSLHMIPGAEFHEINANTRLFSQMVGGISQVRVSLPLLISDETLDKALKIVMTDVVPKERKKNEAVVLMGHGTHHPSDAIYSALMYKAQKLDANLYLGTVEGSPSFDEIKEMLIKNKVKKAYLVPFMTVAGDHAMNDMAGDEPDSWKSQLSKAGIESVPVMKGLAEFDAIVDMWIAQMKGTMSQLK
jgi:sirohydrochlorin cobaltochelatase